VWFLPIAYQYVPYFAIVEKGLQDAFGELGMTVRTCDVVVDPVRADSCVRDATAQGAGGIVTDAVTYEFAPNAFDEAREAGIPVVFMDTGYPSEGFGEWDPLTGYVSIPGDKMSALVADWMIVDSNGEAEVLTMTVSDTGWTKWTMGNGAHVEFEEHCPNCIVHNVDSNAAQTADRPAMTAAALAANPDTNYVLPGYDSTVEPSGALEGVINADYLDRVTGGTTTGQLSGLQLIADGHFLAVNAGTNNYQSAWAAVDQVVRLSVGMDPVIDPVVEMRLFTAENVGELDLTQENFLNGSFYGHSGFQDVYRLQWGIG